VDNIKLKERFLLLQAQRGTSLTDIAKACDWYKTPDTLKVATRLGISPDSKGQLKEQIAYKDAVILCQALDIDYTEIGV
jgi:DNA-binding transcriptional MerR regulator